MARLVVLRGETVDRKIDLLRLPVRIGRGQKNDVVLDDPMKGVSRDHAEIREVDGRYVLVDLESENGIWVAGRRVPDVALEPNVVASIGPFRLTIEGTATAAAAVGERAPATTVVAAPPAAKAPARTTPPPKQAPRPGAAPQNQRNLMIGAAVLAFVAASAITGYLLFRNPEPVVETPAPELTGLLADAERLIGQGLCKEAVAQTIDPALQRYPGNVDLLSVKQRAEGCIPPTPPPMVDPPPFDATVELQAAKDLLGVRDCQGAQQRVETVLIAQPENIEALELRKQVQACLSPAPPPANTSNRNPLAVEIPPDKGGLPPLPNELDRDYQVRVKEMRVRYDEAVAAAAKPSASAIAALEGIVRDATPKYLDAAQRLAETRKAWLATARTRVRESQQFEMKEQFDDAIARLKEAKSIDPSLSVDGDIARIEKVKIERGDEACQAGRRDLAYRQNDAIQSFRRALKFLPPDHPCYQTALKYAGSPGK